MVLPVAWGVMPACLLMESAHLIGSCSHSNSLVISPWECVSPGCSMLRWGPITGISCEHDDIIKWKHFRRYWPFVQGIHWSPMNSPHKGQWRGAWMFSLICAWTENWVNTWDTGDLRCHRSHYDLNIMNWPVDIIPVKNCTWNFLSYNSYEFHLKFQLQFQLKFIWIC